jgi:hypothetical protein
MSDENGQVRAPRWRPVKQLDIVGTAEAADILGVERPRIGRWIKRGVMPPTASELKATPVWHRRDILKMHDWVEANRRRGREPVAD